LIVSITTVITASLSTDEKRQEADVWKWQLPKEKEPKKIATCQTNKEVFGGIGQA
jgi:hypothetical protein